MTTADKTILRELIQQELNGVVHSCHQIDKINSQDDQIKEIHKVVTGNGTPEEGLTFKLGIINERQQAVLKTLQKMEDRRKATPGNIIKWGSFVIAFIGMIMGYASLSSRQKDMQSEQKAIKAETKVTNELLAPDSTQATVSIRGNVYIPVLKTDSANIVRSNKLDSIYERYMRSQQ